MNKNIKRSQRIYLQTFTLILAIAFFGNAFSPKLAIGQDQDFGVQELDGLGGQQDDSNPMQLSASYIVFKGTMRGEVSVTAQIAPEWHTFSVTQPPGGPIRSKIDLKKRDQLKSIGRFTPDHDPKVTENHPEFNIRVEEHELFVTWTAPFEFHDSEDPRSTEIDLIYNGQVCKVICKNFENEPLTASFAGYKDPPKPVAPEVAKPEIKEVSYQPKKSHAVFSGHVVAAELGKTIKPGDKLFLKITAKGLEQFHLYGYSDKPSSDPTSSPTLISFIKDNGWKISEPEESLQPVQGKFADETVWFYKDPVTWTFEVTVPKDAKSGIHQLSGLIGFQTCTMEVCDRPTATRFDVEVPIDGDEIWAPLNFNPADSYTEVKKSFDKDYVAPGQPSKPDKVKIKAEGSKLPWEPFSEEMLGKYAFVKTESGQFEKFDFEKHERSNAADVSSKFSWGVFLQTLVFGFLGGLILNIMPCVLPVIGLKVMSFVQQGGDNRGKAFALNAVYASGIIFVFLILATLGVFAGVTWGKQFQSQEFNIVLASVVFVFALSLIGIWEIPIPGFVGTGKASELTEKEGMTGAFMKGILTTILATPCTGPFIIPVLTWAFQQHWLVIYATFVAMGLGMASPFLIIGANPKLVSFLPKPGNWMVTFKQVMGFILLATVIWVVRAIRFEMVLPVFTLLFGLWLACWWIGKLSLTADLKTKMIRWSVAAIMAAFCGYIGFGPVYKEARSKFDMSYQVRQGAPKERPPGKYTILVDFTADW